MQNPILKKAGTVVSEDVMKQRLTEDVETVTVNILVGGRGVGINVISVKLCFFVFN